MSEFRLRSAKILRIPQLCIPEPLGTDSEAMGWASVTNKLDSHELELKLSISGWTFFYMAGAMRTTAFGFDRAKAIHSALKSLLAHKFLEMPYVSVSGHSRNIQRGVLFAATA